MPFNLIVLAFSCKKLSPYQRSDVCDPRVVVSSAYLLSDMLSATSSVTQQLIRVLMPASKCPLKAGVVTVPPVNITIPDMHTSILDALINSVSFFCLLFCISAAGRVGVGTEAALWDVCCKYSLFDRELDLPVILTRQKGA